MQAANRPHVEGLCAAAMRPPLIELDYQLPVDSSKRSSPQQLCENGRDCGSGGQRNNA